ncbi:MAG: response regulator [Desulfamplus sp.]|nr:response regulator [Desulfamplus sp.]
MKIDSPPTSKEREGFYIKLNAAFAFIFILVVIASGFGIYTLYSLGKVINTTEQKTFPATLAAMRLSERTALIAASAPALNAASKYDDIKEIYSEFEKHMLQNHSDLQSLYNMGDNKTISEVEKSLERVSVIEGNLRKMVEEKLALSKSREDMLDNLLKLQAELDDTLGPLIWGTTSLTKLLGKRTVRMVTQEIDNNSKDIEKLKEALNHFTESSIKPLQTALDIKSESALLMTLLNMAMHVNSTEDIFPLENRAARSFNVFLLASNEFNKGELSKRNPVLSVNLKNIEQNFSELIKGEQNPFVIRRQEIEKERAILSLLNQGRDEAKILSQQIEVIVDQVQHNLHRQAELVSRGRLTGVTALVSISFISCFLSILVAVLTTRALRNRDSAIQKAVVEAERANKIKSQFLANMSHEIRTPMNSVLGFLELVLEDSSITKDQHRQLSTAYNSAKGLLSLINDILDMNKLESGKVIIEKEQFSLIKLIEEIVQIMDIKAKEKALNLRYSIHESLVNRLFLGDWLRLRQVLINLIGNAIKFTHTGSVMLNVVPEPQKVSQRGDCIHFIIEDSGIGIAPDRLKTIFDPFTQADSSTTRKYGGTGLGTTISKQIVELMGGEIWIESQEGVGSKFHFLIPLINLGEAESEANFEKSDNIIANSYKSAMLDRASGQSFKILVAEDIEANAILVKTRLKMLGHDVVVVKNGLEAVRAFESDKFDIILMDVHMPDMDGLEATAQIRKIEANSQNRSSHIPIVALTASVMKDEVKRFLAAGMDSCVGKPIDFNELTKTMEELVKLPIVDSLTQKSEPPPDKPLELQPSFNLNQNSDIDFADGLNRWQDISIYIKSLIDFADSYKEITTTIASLLNFEKSFEKAKIDSDKITEAYKITHAMKGVASNLSIINVAKSAAELNLLLKQYQKSGQKTDQIDEQSIKDIKDALNNLSTSLSSALNAIESLKVKHGANADNLSKNSEDIGKIDKIVDQLQESVEQYSTDGVEPLVEQLEALIKVQNFESMREPFKSVGINLKMVKKYIDDLDFGAANDELSKLKQNINS